MQGKKTERSQKGAVAVIINTPFALIALLFSKIEKMRTVMPSNGWVEARETQNFTNVRDTAGN